MNNSNSNTIFGILLLLGFGGLIIGPAFLIVGIYAYISLEPFGISSIIFGIVLISISILSFTILIIYKNKHDFFKDASKQKEKKKESLKLLHKDKFFCERCLKEITEEDAVLYKGHCLECWKTLYIYEPIHLPICCIIITLLISFIFIVIGFQIGDTVVSLIVAIMLIVLVIPAYALGIRTSIRKLKKEKKVIENIMKNKYKIKISKCYLCDNEAHTNCYNCNKPICETHSTESKFAFYGPEITCLDCARIIEIKEGAKMFIFVILMTFAMGILIAVLFFSIIILP